MKKANAFLAMGRFGQTLRSTVLRTVRSYGQIRNPCVTPTREAMTLEYKAWRDRFMLQRLRLGLLISTACVFTFILRDISQELFHFQEVPKLTLEIKTLFQLLIYPYSYLCWGVWLYSKQK